MYIMAPTDPLLCYQRFCVCFLCCPVIFQFTRRESQHAGGIACEVAVERVPLGFSSVASLGKAFLFLFVNLCLSNQRCDGGLFCFQDTGFLLGQRSSDLKRGLECDKHSSDQAEPKCGGVRSLRESHKLVCVDQGGCLAKYSCRQSWIS